MKPADQIRAAASASGWQTRPMWSIARRVAERGHMHAELLSVYREWGVVPKASRDDNFNRASEDLSNYQFVRRDDLVLNKMKTWQGSLAVSAYEGIVSPAYFVCRVDESAYPRYLHYLLRSTLYINLYASVSKGIRPNQWDLPYDEFRLVPVITPPLEVQRRIADFLDDRVSRVDEAIRLRREQISAVEHRLDLIADDLVAIAKTAGGLVRLKYRSTLLTVGIVVTPSIWYAERGVPALRGTNVKPGAIRLDDLVFLTEEGHRLHRKSQLAAGDVVVVRTGQAGSAAVVPKSLDGANAIDLLIVRPTADLSPEFLAMCLNAPITREQTAASVVGAIQGHFNVETLRDVLVPNIRRPEQERIAEGWVEQRRIVRSLSREMTRQIALLEERKRSLIAAAVTGEFDVSTASGRGI